MAIVIEPSIKIIVFVAEKTRRHTLESRSIQNESRFGADFGPSGIIMPFFFEKEQAEAVTVNVNRYRGDVELVFVHKN